MSEPVEIRLAWNMPNGEVRVETGVFVFKDTTLEQVFKLVKDMDHRPDFIELHLDQFEEE